MKVATTASGTQVRLDGLKEGEHESLRVESATAEDLGLLYSGLRGGGQVVVEDGGVGLEGPLLLAGFVEVVRSPQGPLLAKKPSWAGQAQPLAAKGSVWRLAADDLMEDDLIDESELLSAIDTVTPGTLDLSGLAADACGPSKKPCANCVCGRAETDAAGQAATKKQTLSESGAAVRGPDGKLVVDTIKLKAAAGGCGSCSLGDAFRCAGCPSKGLPAYTVGEKIVLDLE